MGACTGTEDRQVGFWGRGFGRGWGFGRGLGRGRGAGRGLGRGFGRGWGGRDLGPAPLDDDVEGLRAESSRLKAELDAVEDRLARLDKKD
jgi:hypothetical protein